MKKYITYLLISVPHLLSAQCLQLVWADEFDSGTLDASKWEYQLGNGCPSLCGWGNAELQYYTSNEANIAVEDGMLRITALYAPGASQEYTSARIRTKGKASFTGGRMEARMKMPFGQGLWPAFWMLPEDETYGRWPLSGEIDIMEMIGAQPATTHGTIHYGAKWPNNRYSGESLTLNQNLSEDFHVYAVEWKQDTIRWYIDDVLYNTRTPQDLDGYPWRFDRAFHLILNVAVGGYFPGYPDASTTFPQTMLVDWVRVYQSPETAIITGIGASTEGVQSNVNYVIEQESDISVTWSSEASTIAGTANDVNVAIQSWGQTAPNTLSATVTNDVCTANVERQVLGVPLCGVLCDFESRRHVMRNEFTGSTGLDPVPSANAVNSSSTCLRWNPAGDGDDRLGFSFDSFLDAESINSFAGKGILMKIFTNAPAGTQLGLSLRRENTNAVAINSTATVSAAYQWHSVYFPLSSLNTLIAAGANQMMLILPGTPLPYTIYIDDISIAEDACAPVGVEEATADQMQAFWRNGQLEVHAEVPGSARLIDGQGKVVIEMSYSSGVSIFSLEVASGVYFMQPATGRTIKLYIP
jgi:beta-glucanase (GH16 family)